MAEHLNAFQGLINQTTSLEVPLADEVLALLLLGSLPDSWEMLVVTLSKARPEGKHLFLARLKSSLLNEEAHRKYWESGTDSKALVKETDTNRRRGRNRSPLNWDKSGTRLKSRGRPTCFYCGKPGTSKRIVDTSEEIKGEPTVLSRRKFWRKEAQRKSRQAKKSCC